MSTGVLIITGASRGIGRATALKAAHMGYRVTVNYQRAADAAQQAVAEIHNAGGKAIAVAADVSRESDVDRLFETTASQLGPVTALVNNAGILGPQMRLDEMDLTRVENVLTTNVIGVFLCLREAVRRMSTKHGGSGGAIVNVSSIGARLGSPNEYVDYAASKAAVDAMTIGLSKEVAAEGIRVNSVRPGLIYTDIHASGGEPGRVDRLKSRIPMQRGGQPEEVAAAILWLLSPESSFITGSILDVGGGI